MKISYVTIGNALDVHNWSGLEYNIARTLEDQGGKLDFIGNLKIVKSPTLYPKKIFYRIIRQRYDTVRDPHFALQCSNQVRSLLKPDTDIVFSPGSVATALLETDKPKVIYSDATFAGLLDSYVFDYCSSTIKNGHYLEQKALETASLVIYSSDYAARSAVQNYSVDPKKIKVVPFGANILHDFDYEEIKEIIRHRSKQELNLLFIGVDWKRKGGDLAVRITKGLNKAGIKTTLHVVGLDRVPLRPLPRFVNVHGFISKSTKEGSMKILSLMKECHFLLLPTRAEAYGLVFCEANSMGLPSIATNVGGIPTIIKDDINGKMFDPAETEEAYVNYLISIFKNSHCRKYEELALSSYMEYKKRLNWKAAGETIRNLLQEIKK